MKILNAYLQANLLSEAALKIRLGQTVFKQNQRGAQRDANQRRAQSPTPQPLFHWSWITHDGGNLNHHEARLALTPGRGRIVFRLSCWIEALGLLDRLGAYH